MDTSQVMLASGGMLSILIGLLMMLLPVLLVLLVWRILKWTSSTAHQVTRLTEQMDALLRHLQQHPAASAATGSLPLADPQESGRQEEDDFDILAGAPAEEMGESPAPAAAGVPLAAAPGDFDHTEETDDTGFDFPTEEDQAFDGFDTEEQTLEPAASAVADANAGEDEDAFSASEDFDFSMDEEEPDGPAEAVAAADREEDFFAAGGETDAAMAGAFDAEEPATAEPEADQASDEEDRRMEESFDSAFPAADAREPAAEQAAAAAEPDEPAPAAVEESEPAIVPLDDDPARPEVSLARCGRCDHKLAYKKTLAGKKARCPSCKEPFILP